MRRGRLLLPSKEKKIDARTKKSGLEGKVKSFKFKERNS